MDILGTMITGKNPGLLEKSESKEIKAKPNPVEEWTRLGIKIKNKDS